VHRGTPAERAFSVSGAAVMGRGPQAQIRVDDRHLSNRHLKIEPREGGIALEDLGSRNGTFVDGARVERAEVRAGGSFACGSLLIHVVEDDEESPPPALRGGEELAKFIPSIVKEMPSFEEPFAEIVRREGGDILPVSARPTEQELRRSRSRLAILLKVSALLSSPESIDGLLAKILDLLFQILDVSRGALLLLDANGVAQPRAVRSVTADEGPAYSRTIVRQVLETGRAGLFQDAQTDARLHDARSVAQSSIRAAMGVPLKPTTETIGVLYVDNLARPHLFAEEDLDFLMAFANQAALAIENARLHKRVEEQAVLRETMLRFFPPTTARRLAEAKNASLPTVETEVTAVFADISNFTSLSARMSPRAVVDLLNEYFPAMADVVFEYEGTLEKYIGDALLAVWGAPYAQADDADRAVHAAMEMHRVVERLNLQWAREGRPTINIHIGMATGMVAAGNIGSDRYLQYATIGDTTNIASRICGVAGEGELLVADSTHRKLRDRAVQLTPLDPVVVKGKDLPLLLHRVEWNRSRDLRETVSIPAHDHNP
jgi:adenylate cyclase